MTIKEAKELLKNNNIRYILAQFVDIHGVAKTKSVPIAHFESILTDGAGFAGFAVWGLGQEPHSPDFMAIGDLDTLSVVPWQPGYARIVCEGHVEKKPWPLDTRNILKQQVALLKERGWLLNTGLEPEMMLLERSEFGDINPADPSDLLEKPCYDYKGLSRNREFIEKLVDSLIEVGIDVYQIDHEDANGQFEINFTYSDAITSADRYVFVRMAASEIAHDLGMICSFMPKPKSDRTGNAMHIHMSIADDNGTNLFRDDSDANNLGLSKMAYHFIGGIFEHAHALAAFCAPTVNSYKRLVVGRSQSGSTWAPAYISYGDNNRSAMIRVPYGRLELRMPDAGCNPYLATAATIAAGLDGIDRELDPGLPQNINHYNYTMSELREKHIRVLPQSLKEAIDALEKDGLFAEKLGKTFIQEFINLKDAEWVEYQRHVSDWEVNRYLEYF